MRAGPAVAGLAHGDCGPAVERTAHLQRETAVDGEAAAAVGSALGRSHRVRGVQSDTNSSAKFREMLLLPCSICC
jgi:hypothetical protein